MRSAFVAIAMLTCLATATLSRVYAERPNIVIVMTDDMGYSDLGCYGGEIATPNIDQLASGGVRFANFYSENMCWVSRAALLTGLYHRTSMKASAIHPKCVTLPEKLSDQGYATYLTGKWHLGGKKNSVSPLDRGFDHFYGIPGGASSFFAPHRLTRDRTPIETEFQSEDYYFTHAISENAEQYIRQTPTEQPLFLYVTYTAAHWPLHALPDDIATYSGKYSSGWDQLRKQRLAKMKSIGIVSDEVELSPRHPKVPAWSDEKHKAWQERRMEVYAAQVSAMDRGVGQITQALQDTGRLENTLLLYTTDNGGCHVEYGVDRKGDYLPETTRDGRPMKPGNVPDIMPGPEDTYQSYGHGWANLSNTPFRFFKQYDHEGGIRTPLIAHWPKRIKAAGTISRQVAHLVDLMPTILDITQIEHKPSHTAMRMDGQSILRSLLGTQNASPRELYFSHNKGRAIRSRNWKAVYAKEGKKSKWELYDLEKDPAEVNDLAEEEPKRLNQLKEKWNDWSEAQQLKNAIK